MDLRVLNKRQPLFLGLALLVSGCGVTEHDVKGKSAEVVYQEAEKLLKAEEFEDAASRFKDVETFFPYSEKASTAQIMSAYSSFKNKSYPDAIREIEVFLRYHPSHKLVSYAMYLKAVSKYMTISSVGRDANQAKEARTAFVELVNRFPDCKYADDARKKIIALDDIIAAHELAIGRFYQQRKSSLSAINRYNYIIAKFPYTKSAEEAFYRLAECCLNEGMTEEANNAIAVLEQRYPNGEWTTRLKELRQTYTN